ncbi:MAG TPA: lipid-binding SYLF domain-containing protein [Candidatus Polarisedimenticolaceae bacterium]
MKAIPIVLASLLSALPIVASDRGAEQERLQKAESVVKAALESPDKGIPRELLERAECVGVFPDVKKAAFIVGGQGGRGIFTCRDEDGELGAPAFFKLAGGSVGWQFGGQEADVVLLIMNRDGMKNLLQDKFAIGGEASATAGPVGRDAKAATDAQLQAQMLSWSRSQGLFLGASLSGSVIRPDAEANAKYYGKEVTANGILVKHEVRVPRESRPFVSLLNKIADRG